MLAWIPESLLNEKGKEEWDKFVRIEEKPGVDDEDDGTSVVCKGGPGAITVITDFTSLCVFRYSVD